MPEITFNDDEIRELNHILRLNAKAVDETDAVRWSEESADRIKEIKNKVENQINQ